MNVVQEFSLFKVFDFSKLELYAENIDRSTNLGLFNHLEEWERKYKCNAQI